MAGRQNGTWLAGGLNSLNSFNSCPPLPGRDFEELTQAIDLTRYGEKRQQVMGRYVDLAKDIEADVTCGEPAHELNEFNEKRSGGGTEPVQPETGDAARWGDLAPIVEWFLGSTPPAEPFQLKPGITILDPQRWRQAIAADIKAGPNGPRARYGAVQDDLSRLFRLFGGQR